AGASAPSPLPCSSRAGPTCSNSRSPSRTCPSTTATQEASMATRRDQAQLDAGTLRSQFSALNLPFMLENYQAFAQTAADKHWSHLDYLTELLGGEAAARDDRRVQRCIKLA